MADPNRKINLDLPSDEEDSDGAETFSPSEITLVKEFEEEFKNRFTDDDETFSEFCKQEKKPPPIVFPFDAFHHNNRGGQRGRFQPYGNRGGYDNRRHHDNNRQDNREQGNRYSSHHYNRGDHHQPPAHKRPRDDSYQSGSY